MPEFDTDSKLAQEYKYGFYTDIEQETIPKGLSEDVVRIISAKKEEPEWMLEWRLKAYRRWLKMSEPRWAYLDYPKIDYQDIHYFSAPKKQEEGQEMDPELLKTFERLGIPMNEREALSGVAMDVVFDSVSVGTTHTELLEKEGIIFCSISEAIQKHPDLVKQYLGTVVPPSDNFFAALNSAVFTDGSFCFIPKGVRCPMELSTYFRINAADTGQFERTLIVCEDDAYCSYLEGCTAPARDNNQLHAAVVEIVALNNAEVKYSTVQNWYAGDENGKGGIYNFVTKRGHCRGHHSKISWTQVEVGAAITWKYPSVVMEGDYSSGEFYSVALTNKKMQADTGTKMIHVGKNTSSTIVSKGISADQSSNNYRGLVQVNPGADNARNHSACDSLLIGRECSANTFPYIESENASAVLAHEATTSSISEEQLFYLRSRGIAEEDAASLVVRGFCKDVFKQLPLEFSVEAIKLLEIKLEGSIG
ncbi:MAG: Fe-S cluster assembly protein SufB [Verrucomicrobia bacterium]|nr:Fe-S cluster assembly protein SufB [Verrucomicrobiota bacterium]MCH8525640.1 Fe-S cluster assembly protein SufB [Kiritimatiellia bacterium]